MSNNKVSQILSDTVHEIDQEDSHVSNTTSMNQEDVTAILQKVALEEDEDQHADLASPKGVTEALRDATREVIGNRDDNEKRGSKHPELYMSSKHSSSEEEADEEFLGTQTYLKNRKNLTLKSSTYEKLYQTNTSKSKTGPSKSRRDKSPRRKSKSSSSLRRSSHSSTGTNSQYSKADDALHCTFQPKINTASRGMVQESTNYLQRVEADFERTINDREYQRGKEVYDSKVDKKECPNCRTVQSYDEYRSRKNKCKECGVPYKHPKSWNDVGSNFLDRVVEKQRTREQKLGGIESKVYEGYSKSQKVVFSQGKLQSVDVEAPRWDDVAGEFLNRMESDLVKRKSNIVSAQKRYEKDPNCTFEPKLNHRNNDDDELMDDFSDRMERDIQRRTREKQLQQTEDFREQQLKNAKPTTVLKGRRAAWDQPTHTGGQRRNISGQWI